MVMAEDLAEEEYYSDSPDSASKDNEPHAKKVCLPSLDTFR